jgi:hypothetical protein
MRRGPSPSVSSINGSPNPFLPLKEGKMRAIRLIALLLLATAAAWSTTNSVKIGTLKYVGTSVNHH